MTLASEIKSALSADGHVTRSVITGTGSLRGTIVVRLRGNRTADEMRAARSFLSVHFPEVDVWVD